VRVPANEDLADLVTDRMVKLDGIRETETLIAFRAYSRKDIEAGFSLGSGD
jgi:DNA-binding Lrp family transcriptional regulator